MLRREEALIALAAALLLVVGGLVWRFGAYGMIGGGSLVVVVLAIWPGRSDRR